ncbi:PPC domain-containing protein [Pectinatus frisingensis]|uniref:PPC domain-containing protein n=1 Tax=Pectinatus frisingensis TaxID=865 RepID=UPI0018C52712|nr:PPC domain-containing protein [Pectinatus frisingensis]
MSKESFQVPQNVKMNFDAQKLFGPKESIEEIMQMHQEGEYADTLSSTDNTKKLIANLIKNKEPFIELSKLVDSSAERKTILPMPKTLSSTSSKNIVYANAAANASPPNSTPNGAYVINFGTLYTDSISAKGDQRWYAFQLTAEKKLTVYMSPVADTAVDNDLYLYKFDQTNSSVTVVAQSRNKAGMYELLSYVAAAGIYFISVNSYACNTTNNFQIMAFTSDTWDEAEGDDSMTTAKEMPVNSEIIGTLDNSVDQDCRIWLVKEKGTYQLQLSVPSTALKYQVQIFSSSQNLITSMEQNARVTFPNVAPGGYYLKIVSVDGKIDPAVKYNFSMILLPPNIIDTNAYKATISPSGKQLIEVLAPGAVEGLKCNVLFIDRKEFDPTLIDFSTGRPSFPGYQCGGLSGTTSFILDEKSDPKRQIILGSYTSDLINVNNAIIFTVANCLYFWQLRQHVYNNPPASYGPPTHVYSGGTDQNGVHYNTYVWRDEIKNTAIQFIFDIDKMKVVDMYNPNFFYGYPHDRAGVSGNGTHTFTQTKTF